MKYKDGNTWKEITIKALDSMPIGCIILFAGSAIPTGWLKCEGQSLLRTEYSELFGVINTIYGNADSTHFNLPNYKGRVPVGLNSSDTDFDTLGETGGEKTHQLTINEMPSHTHEGLTWTDTDSITLNGGSGTGYNLAFSGGIIAGQENNIHINAKGGGQPHNNLQPYIVVNYIIKAKNTTPTMASIVDAYSTSTQDGYSANYVNELVGGTILYNNTSGSNGNVTLSNSASNYSYIEIYGYKSGCYSYQKIYSPNGKTFCIDINNVYSSTNIQQIFATYTISGTTITKNHEIYMNDGGTPVASNDLYITRVIGYK